MPETDGNVFLLFVRRLNSLGIRYMVTGSVASIAYGEARLTHDVDIVVEISARTSVDSRRCFQGAISTCLHRRSCGSR